MVKILLTLFLVLAMSQTTREVSDAQKREFIDLLKTLPVKGEFYADESIKKAGPYMPVLFALTEADTEKYDLYPFLALSRGLCDHKEQRDYAVQHFAEIQHPVLKLGWGVMLFDAGMTSPQVVQFLRDALKSEGLGKMLAEMLGPEFANFQRRIKTATDIK